MGNGNTRHKNHKRDKQDNETVNVPGSATPRPDPQLQAKRENSNLGKDVMISYSHQDIEIMRTLKSLLEASDVSVWVDETGLSPGASYLREIGEAIVDSCSFLVILSLDSVTSKYVQDEVSLAYISNKSIFAVAVNPFEELTPVMDLGMKLTLSAVQWHFVGDNKNEAEELKPLLSSMKAALSGLKQPKQESDQETGASEGEEEESNNNYVMNKQAFKLRRLVSRAVMPSLTDEEVEQEETDREFWPTNFGNATEVEWSKFSQAVLTSYDDLWKQMLVTEQQKQLLLHLMSKEMVVKKGILSYKEFKKFCMREREKLPLSQAIRLYAAETYAMKEVFNVNSSVRLSAIANLGKYQSKAVIDSLLDLLEENEDPDVTVVAAISLAHAASGMKMFKRRAEEGLIGYLDHKDRLVRESGCLALGRLKSKRSIAKLVQLWRNDTISSVREAAQIAIDQIGGEEAEQALHVTKVLSEEISHLKKE